jgi:hypothetical protein
VESWPARWSGVRRRCRCSRRWSSAAAPAPCPQLVHVLSPPARRGASRACRRRPGGEVVLAPVRLLAPSLSGAVRRRRARFFPQSGAHGRWWKRKPQEGVGGLASVPHRPAPFESTPRAARGGEKPSMPLAVRRAGQVALAVVLGSASDARREGVEASLAFPAVASSPTRTCRSSACVPAGRSGRAPPRTRWCGETGGAGPARCAGGLVRIRGCHAGSTRQR